MNIVNKILLLTLLLTVGQALTAQHYSYSQLIKEADKAYESAHFLKAVEYYTKAIEQNKDHKPEVLFRLGDAAYQNRSLALAKESFEKFVVYEDSRLTSEAMYRLGRIAHMEGNYEEAVRQYDLYLSEFEDVDEDITENLNKLKTSAAWALSADINNEIDTVIRLDNNINSPNSDNAPFFYEDKLYYSSLRYPIEKDKYKRYKSMLLEEESIYDIPGIDKDKLLSNPAFTPEGDKLFFTVCGYEQVYQIRCDIFSASIDESGSISMINKLPENVNAAGFTTSHPSYAREEGTEFLYFSSNKSGGKGGSDIWRVEITDSGYGEATNVFPVNTEGDELTPFFHNSTGNLYFSSNGLSGYGGHDIFRFTAKSTEPENMGKLLNSSYNDVHYFLKDDASEGYFSSNRPGSLYPENSYETCCYDIYSSKSKECKVDLKTLAFDSDGKQPLAGVRIEIKDADSGESYYNKVSDNHISDLKLPCGKNLSLTASKQDYVTLEMELDDIKGIYGEENAYTKELILEKDYSEMELRLSVFEEVAKDPLKGATVYLTDLKTNEQITIAENGSHTFNIPLIPNRDYTLEVNKDGFKEGSITFNSGDGDLKINKEVILEYLDVVEKSKVSLANAIPVTLYFDNDSPDPRTTKATSSKTYTQTYDEYYNKKSEYKRKYLGLFGNSDKITAEGEMNNLFDGQLKRGFDRYDVFKKQLLIVLQDGQDINIYLKGYASPLAQNDYNTALGKRRVDSVRKEFDSWNNGALLPFIRSGQLKVTERSFGETTAATGVSDDPSSPSKSIYSPQAALERRVEIEEINFNK